MNSRKRNAKAETKIKINLKQSTSKKLEINYKRGCSTNYKNQPLSMERNHYNLQ